MSRRIQKWAKGKIYMWFQHGEGIIKYPNGDQFEGFFKDNLKDGYGHMKYVTGETREGLWREDKYVGDADAIEKKLYQDSKQVCQSNNFYRMILKKLKIIALVHIIMCYIYRCK